MVRRPRLARGRASTWTVLGACRHDRHRRHAALGDLRLVPQPRRHQCDGAFSQACQASGPTTSPSRCATFATAAARTTAARWPPLQATSTTKIWRSRQPISRAFRPRRRTLRSRRITRIGGAGPTLYRDGDGTAGIAGCSSCHDEAAAVGRAARAEGPNTPPISKSSCTTGAPARGTTRSQTCRRSPQSSPTGTSPRSHVSSRPSHDRRRKRETGR